MENYTNLYVRFNIEAVEKKFNTGAYGGACYKTVFRNVPADLLQGCRVSMGDSSATLSGRENVCVVGLAAPEEQLQSIHDVLVSNSEFLSVSAIHPLAMDRYGSEPLVADGVYTADGSLLRVWAKSAFVSLQTKSPAPAVETKTETAYSDMPFGQTFISQVSPAAAMQEYVPENIPEYAPEDISEDVPRKRHGCLTTWLILIMVVNTALMVLTLAMKDELRISNGMLAINLAGVIALVVSCILILNWKKFGIYLMLLTYAVMVVAGLVSGLGVQSFQGILALVILWGLLNKKSSDGVSAWNNMD